MPCSTRSLCNATVLCGQDQGISQTLHSSLLQGPFQRIAISSSTSFIPISLTPSSRVTGLNHQSRRLCRLRESNQGWFFVWISKFTVEYRLLFFLKQWFPFGFTVDTSYSTCHIDLQEPGWPGLAGGPVKRWQAASLAAARSRWDSPGQRIFIYCTVVIQQKEFKKSI